MQDVFSFMKSAATFLSDNPWLYPAATGLLSVLVHAFATRSPRFVAALQAVSLDLPKLWQAVTGKAPPAVVATPAPADAAPLRLVGK